MLVFVVKVEGQNYNTVIPSQQQFFQLDNSIGFGWPNANTIWSPVKVLYFDSSSIITNGISRFSFYSWRDTNYMSQCVYENGPAWMGYEMQEYNNGLNLFFNIRGDTIRIETLASVNDSWHLYDSINGDYIRAHVDSITWMQYGGVLDSVKCISLSALDNAGLLLPGNPVNGLSILLSKSNGFLRTIAFREFPDGYIPILDRTDVIYMPTMAQIYDFNVDDEFEFEGGCYFHPFFSLPTSSHQEYFKILSKFFNVTLDTVIYQRYRIYLEYDYPASSSIPYDTFYFAGIDTVKYPYNNTLLYPTFPEENLYNLDSSILINYILDQNTGVYCNLPVYTQVTGIFYYNQPADSCYMLNNFEPTPYTVKYVTGLGIVYTDTDQRSIAQNDCDNQLVWFRKGNFTCGNYFSPTGIGEHYNYDSKLDVYPNPSNGSFTITTNTPLSNPQIKIYNMMGAIVYSEKIKTTAANFSKQINLNAPAGIYFVKVSDQGKQYTKKLVVE